MNNVPRLARSVGAVLRTHYPPIPFGLPLGDVEPDCFRGDLELLAPNHQPRRNHEHRRALRDRRKTGGADFRRRHRQLWVPLQRATGAVVPLFVPTCWMCDSAPERPAASVGTIGAGRRQVHAHRPVPVFDGQGRVCHSRLRLLGLISAIGRCGIATARLRASSCRCPYSVAFSLKQPRRNHRVPVSTCRAARTDT
jgi:hypothetical protein